MPLGRSSAETFSEEDDRLLDGPAVRRLEREQSTEWERAPRTAVRCFTLGLGIVVLLAAAIAAASSSPWDSLPPPPPVAAPPPSAAKDAALRRELDLVQQNAELRKRLEKVGDPSRPLERAEAEAAYRERTDDMCCICQEDWQDGDPVRCLRQCRHIYHLECIDRWAFAEAARGRQPHCPLCNAAL